MIDSRQLNHFRSKLQQRGDALRGEIRQTLLKSDHEPYLAIADQVRDLGDDALADLCVDINLAEIDRDIGELRDVEAALRRIAAASYGLCEGCGKLIDANRLEAYPAAACCVTCQSAREKMRVRTPTL